MRLVQGVSVLAVLATGYWLGQNFGPESIAAAIGSIAAYLALDIRQARKGPSNHDLELYSRIRELFSPGMLRFLKEFDFAASFDRDALDPVLEFVHSFDDSTQEFIDRSIEKKRRKLHQAAKELAVSYAQRTFPMENRLDRSGVPHEWERTNPELREKAVAELNSRATALARTHDDFTRTAKRRLLGGTAG